MEITLINAGTYKSNPATKTAYNEIRVEKSAATIQKM